MQKSFNIGYGDAPCHGAEKHQTVLPACAGDRDTVDAGLVGRGHRPDCTRLGNAPLRPSSARRIEKLQALVAELMVRDMGYGAVASFLTCSSSAARNYIHELHDAGVVRVAPIRQPAGCIDKLAYRLNGDHLLSSTSAQRDPLVAALFGAPS